MDIKYHDPIDSGPTAGKTKTLLTKLFSIISCISLFHAYVYTSELKHADAEDTSLFNCLICFSGIRKTLSKYVADPHILAAAIFMMLNTE